jgi:hypothetical protein
MLSRTAKSCGPDAPTLASSLRRHVGPTGRGHSIFAGDGGKRARCTTYAVKTIAQGMPGVPVDLWLYPCAFYIAQGAAGAAGTRRSLRPLRTKEFMHSSGASRREREVVCGFDVIAERKRPRTLSFRGDAKHRTRNLEIPRCAIAHLRSGPEPVIGRRKRRPVGTIPE